MSKENTLFNGTTIKRLISDIKLTVKQKKAVKIWLGYLKNKKLENEKQAYIEFANLILKDLLDYDISLHGLKHEEANIEFLFKKNGNNLICFEAKGAKTKDLWAYQGRDKKSRETPVNQINSYMYEQKIPFGILTNYHFFVLFDRNEGSKKYHLIDFTELTDENKLKEFVALFSREQVERGFISEVIKQSIIEEREFTKEFYKLYHETRLMLIKEFEENSEIGREASVHFAQLYLNRLMFVFFAEDTGKIDKRIIENRILKTLDSIHLFSSNSSNISNVLVGLFKDLDKGSDFPVKLFGFNGGLFSHPIPPKIYFKDFRENKFFVDVNKYSKLKKKDLELNEKQKETFEKYKNKLSPIVRNILLMASHDFNTEVNVNILGNVFEQSISDIEDLKTDKSSRRKKEGVFYTPEYITDYICRNTIIPYLSKKNVTTVPNLIKEYAENIGELEEKFKSIKILDPACGSGAFLIKATDVMLDIFKAIQEFKQSSGEYEAKRGLKKKSNTKGQIVLSKWNEEDEAREIIEKSIYGVDINEESVEITKLSLFLKMARKNRKLTDLSDNIKRGNSLIDDPEVAGDLAFDWDKEFPFKFDVVIGNPPYVRVQNLKHSEIDWYKSNKQSAFKRVDISILFIELAKSLLKKKGIVAYITSNQFLMVEYGRKIREFILNNYKIRGIVDFGDLPLFEDALTYVSIFVFENNIKSNFKYLKINDLSEAKDMNIKKGIEININDLDDNQWILSNKTELKLIDKLDSFEKLGGIGNAWAGLFTGMDNVLMFDKDEIKKLEFEKELILPVIRGNDPRRYSFANPSKYVIYPYKVSDGKTIVMTEMELKKFPRVYNYLLANKSKLVKRKDSRKTFEDRKDWFSLVRFGNKRIFEKIKIVTPGEVKNHKFSLDISRAGFSCARVFAITVEEKSYNIKFLLTLLNSKTVRFYLQHITPLKQGSYHTYSSSTLNKIPIKNISLSKQKPFIEKADSMLKLNKEFYEKKDKFLKLIKHEYKLEKINRKLDKFYGLEFDDFMKQLKINLSMDKKSELLDFFEKNKKELQNLKDKIEKTDNEINQMVYKIYGLTKDEIKIVEESLK